MGLTQYKKPKIKILYNDADKTSDIKWSSIQITDNESNESDSVNITMLWGSLKPRFKDEIKIFVDDNYLGSFIISAIKINYKKSYEVEAISADFMGGFKTKKNRTFEKQSYEQIIQSIAKENNFKYKINFPRSKEILSLEQHDESDAALCQKMADDLGLTFSVKNSTLIFIDKDRNTQRVEYNLSEDEIISLNYEFIEVEKFNSCEITWQDTKKGKKKITKVGTKEPILKKSAYAKDENEAIKIANSSLISQKDKELKGSLSCVGVPFFAGGYITLTLSEDENIKAIIKKINHSISTNWSCNIEFC